MIDRVCWLHYKSLLKEPNLSHIWSVAEQKFFWNYRWEPSSGLRGWETSAPQPSGSIIKGSFCWNWSNICNIKGLVDCTMSSQEIRCVPVEEGVGLFLISPALEHLRWLWSLEGWRRKTAAEQLSPLPCWWICSSRPQAFLITLVLIPLKHLQLNGSKSCRAALINLHSWRQKVRENESPPHRIHEGPVKRPVESNWKTLRPPTQKASSVLLIEYTGRRIEPERRTGQNRAEHFSA